MKKNSLKNSALSEKSIFSYGVSLENLKRANAADAKFSTLGFSKETDEEIAVTVFHRDFENTILQGDLKISC